MSVWVQILAAVRNKVGTHIFETWFAPVCFDGFEAGTLRLNVPNETFKIRLLDHYSGILGAAARETTGAPVTLEVSSVEAPPARLPQRNPSAAEGHARHIFNSTYTFDSFVTGPCNKFACTVAHLAAKQPSKSYNPIYIYGHSGCGKTHLTHAVGNFIQGRNTRITLCYMSCESFVNDMVRSLSSDCMFQFRERYRTIDVLLIDDIQFLAGKQRIQEEFLHTFNALYDTQKQIVVTSDCPPAGIPTVQERLHSRFQWGVIAGIEPPDLETKIRILRKKAGSRTLPDEVTAYIAGSIESNIRELEGALNCVTARASVEGIADSDLDVQFVERVLTGLSLRKKAAPTLGDVLAATATYYAMKPAQLKSRNNSPLVAVPRQVAMFVSREITAASLGEIGKEFGGKHHTTVLHSIRKIEKLRKEDSEVSDAIAKVMQAVGGKAAAGGRSAAGRK